MEVCDIGLFVCTFDACSSNLQFFAASDIHCAFQVLHCLFLSAVMYASNAPELLLEDWKSYNATEMLKELKVCFVDKSVSFIFVKMFNFRCQDNVSSVWRSKIFINDKVMK